jgi:hypothetical protein
MIVLKTTDTWKHGQKNIVPYLGEIEIGEDGLIHVDLEKAEAAQKLIDLDINFHHHKPKEEKIKPQTTEEDEDLSKKKEDKDSLITQVEESDILDESGFSAEKVELVELIRSQTVEQLRSTCKELGYKKIEWENLKKAELRRYLIKKL